MYLSLTIAYLLKQSLLTETDYCTKCRKEDYLLNEVQLPSDTILQNQCEDTVLVKITCTVYYYNILKLILSLPSLFLPQHYWEQKAYK